MRVQKGPLRHKQQVSASLVEVALPPQAADREAEDP